MSDNIGDIIKGVSTVAKQGVPRAARKVVKKKGSDEVVEVVNNLNAVDQDVAKMSEEMALSMTMQSRAALEVGRRYLFCAQHGYVEAVDVRDPRPICRLCGSKMFQKKYEG